MAAAPVNASAAAAAAAPPTRPENMLPIMIVLGVMFLGICIAMNLFSRARFKKRTNAFKVAGRSTTPVRRSHRPPGSCQRLETPRISQCPSPGPRLSNGKQYQCATPTNLIRQESIGSSSVNV